MNKTQKYVNIIKTFDNEALLLLLKNFCENVNKMNNENFEIISRPKKVAFTSAILKPKIISRPKKVAFTSAILKPKVCRPKKVAFTSAKIKPKVRRTKKVDLKKSEIRNLKLKKPKKKSRRGYTLIRTIKSLVNFNISSMRKVFIKNFKVFKIHNLDTKEVYPVLIAYRNNSKEGNYKIYEYRSKVVNKVAHFNFFASADRSVKKPGSKYFMAFRSEEDFKKILTYCRKHNLTPNWYELLEITPCNNYTRKYNLHKLYADIDLEKSEKDSKEYFKKIENNLLMAIYIHYAAMGNSPVKSFDEFKENYGFAVTDSSTDKKLSYHVVLNRLNKSVPHLVGAPTDQKYIWKNIEEKAEKVILNGKLKILDFENFYAPVDMAVYSKSRSMRTIYSSKIGQNRPLLPMLSAHDFEISDYLIQKSVHENEMEDYKILPHYDIRYANAHNAFKNSSDSINTSKPNKPKKNNTKKLDAKKSKKFIHNVPDEMTPYQQLVLSYIENNAEHIFNKKKIDELIKRGVYTKDPHMHHNSIFIFAACMNGIFGNKVGPDIVSEIYTKYNGGIKETWNRKKLSQCEIPDPHINNWTRGLYSMLRHLDIPSFDIYNTAVTPPDLKIDPSAFKSVENINRKKLGKKLFRKFLKSKDQTLCVKSSCGTGKTWGLFEALKEFPALSVLVITNRILLAKEFSSKYNISFYKADYPGDLSDHNRLAIQVESLYKIHDSTYDIVIMDECEQVFAQFYSKTVEVPRLVENTFLNLLRNKSGKFVFMSATMTKCTQRTVEKFLPLDRFVHNKYAALKNKKFEYFLEPGNKAVEKFTNRVYNLLKQGKKVICPSNSRTALLELETLLKASGMDENKIRFYSAHSPAAHKSDFEDVNKNWVKYNCVGFTTVIEAGISFEVDHFDVCVAYFRCKSCPADAAFQQLFRARPVNDFEIFYKVTDPGQTEYSSESRRNMLKAIAALAVSKACNFDLEGSKLLEMQAINMERCEFLRDNIMEVNTFIKENGGDPQHILDRNYSIPKEDREKINKEFPEVWLENKKKDWTNLEEENRDILINFNKKDGEKRTRDMTKEEKDKKLLEIAEKYSYTDPVKLTDKLNNRSILENHEKKYKLVKNTQGAKSVRFGLPCANTAERIKDILIETGAKYENSDFYYPEILCGNFETDTNNRAYRHFINDPYYHFKNVGAAIFSKELYESILRKNMLSEYKNINMLFVRKKQRFINLDENSTVEEIKKYTFRRLHLKVKSVLYKYGYDIDKVNPKKKNSDYKLIRI